MVFTASPKHAVSTHSRPKAAGAHALGRASAVEFQHTAARRRLGGNFRAHTTTKRVSTHSRPKAAGCCTVGSIAEALVSTHSRPKAAGTGRNCEPKSTSVSTHSRPKAAGLQGHRYTLDRWFQHTAARRRLAVTMRVQQPRLRFQHTAARRRLAQWVRAISTTSRFQHTAARRRLV